MIDSGVARGSGGAYIQGEKNFFGVKNLKTLKISSLFVLVNYEPKIIELSTLEPPTICPPTGDVARGAVGAYMLPLKKENSRKKRGATGVLDVWLQHYCLVSYSYELYSSKSDFIF